MNVGTEWLVEATGCSREILRDEAMLRSVFALVIDDLQLKTIDEVWHKFAGEGGVTGLAALTESHLTCHTYPEHGVATFNLYCCRERPEWDWETKLRDMLGAGCVTVTKIERGGNNVPQKLVQFGEINIRSRGRLPHWEKEDGIYFVTFRLADSLPQNVLDQLKFERTEAEKILKTLDRELSISEKQKLDWLFSEKVDEYLDMNYGNCFMRNPAIAEIVADSIKHFDNVRYHLYAWCVMPNHAHVVFKPLQRHKLDEILHSWKSFSANEANNILGRSGAFWQREYYDHLVRSDSDLSRVVAYVLNNPIKAKLKNWRWVESFRKKGLTEGA